MSSQNDTIFRKLKKYYILSIFITNYAIIIPKFFVEGDTILNYKEAIEYIHMTNKFGSVLGLDNILNLLDRLGNPQKDLKVIHIAGTNGKGSISTMMNKVLMEAEYDVGLYTSPFLEKFNERIKINNNDIPDEDIAHYLTEVKEKIDKMTAEGLNHPTEFEIITAMALYYFKEKNVDIVILEVGLGGRLDATNVIDAPILEIIASISFDHTEYLGNTLKQIAYEKGGIIKENSKVILYPSHKEALNELIRISKEKNASYYLTNKGDIELIKTDINGSELYYKKENTFGLDKFSLSLLGKNQIYNVLTVIKSLEVLKKDGYNINKCNIEKALNNIHFNGRFEVYSKNPFIILDGGHNKEGVESFVDNIKLYLRDKKIVLFFGMLADKDIDSALKKLIPLAKKIYTLTPNNNRAFTSKDMYEKIKKVDNHIEVTYLNNISEIPDLIDKNSDETYAFVGSLYMIGEVRTILKKLKN